MDDCIPIGIYCNYPKVNLSGHDYLLNYVQRALVEAARLNSLVGCCYFEGLRV